MSEPFEVSREAQYLSEFLDQVDDRKRVEILSDLEYMYCEYCGIPQLKNGRHFWCSCEKE